MLVNGGELSGLVTDELEPNRSKRRVKIFESDEETAKELSKHYGGSRVSVSRVRHDDSVALKQEGIDEADVVASALQQR